MVGELDAEMMAAAENSAGTGIAVAVGMVADDSAEIVGTIDAVVAAFGMLAFETVESKNLKKGVPYALVNR